jgi:Pyruvate/2-oxoacid:ferredoxin oxidoreductase delta subunit
MREFMVSSPKDESFYTEKQLQEIADDIDKAVTIPVNIMIEADHRVYDFSEVKEILSEAQRIVVQDCGCKTAYGNCDSPRDVCLGLDCEVDYALKNKGAHAKEITLDEALGVLRRSHEAGLVHMAYVMKGEEKPTLLCSCCSCCCHTLGGLLRHGIHAQVLSSKYIASDDEVKCIDCSDCVSRCVFEARRMESDKLVYDASKCLGCGLCVTTCPTNAISMKSRDHQ